MEFKQVEIFCEHDDVKEMKATKELSEMFIMCPIVYKEKDNDDYSVVGYVDETYAKDDKIYGNVWLRDKLFQDKTSSYSIDYLEYEENNKVLKPVSLIIRKEEIHQLTLDELAGKNFDKN